MRAGGNAPLATTMADDSGGGPTPLQKVWIAVQIALGIATIAARFGLL